MAPSVFLGADLGLLLLLLSLLPPQVHLRLILVSGKTQDFTFSPNDSATDIAKHVFDNWPAGERGSARQDLHGTVTSQTCSLLLCVGVRFILLPLRGNRDGNCQQLIC